MDLRQPVLLNFETPPAAVERVATLIDHYDTRIYLTPGGYLDVGAGSIRSALRVLPTPGFVGCIGTIGRWSEFGGCTVMHGQEHRNDEPVNLSFTQHALHLLHAGSKTYALEEPTPIRIGSGVVISSGAIILDGASIGDGAVIGAGAVLTSDAEPFGVYVGTPASKIRDRMDPVRCELAQRVRWWDFEAAYMVENMARLQELSLEDRDHPRMAERPRLVFRLEPQGDLSFLGVSDGPDTVPAPPKVNAYVDAAFGDGPYTWLADVFAE